MSKNKPKPKRIASPAPRPTHVIPPNHRSILEQYNALDASRRVHALAQLGFDTSNRDVVGVLTKSHFVIPGKTRFACQNCGECCRYARKVAQLTYEPCPFLTEDNRCAKHDTRYLVCKWFPFWVHHDPRFGDILTIKPYCSGYGKGPLVDYAATVRQIRELEAKESHDSDGAFVIHEVLLIPGRKDWAFPSKANVDALMRYLAIETGHGGATPPERSLERAGEVAFAHRFTSGLLGTLQEPLLTVDEHGGITDANEPICSLFQRPRGDLVSRTLASFFVNPDRVSASLQTCLSHGKATASPHRLRLPGDTAIPVLFDALVYRDRNDGLVHGSLLCIHPASAATYHEILQSREYARGLLEASLDALMVIDKDGAVIDVNEAAVQISGRSREQLIGRPFQDLFADPALARRGVETAFQQGTVRNYELTLVSSRNEAIPVSFNAAVYRDSEGVVQGVFAAARDIRERIKMMQALQDAQRYSRGLIECCLDLMVTIDRNGTITDANRAASDLTGLPRERIIGAPFERFFDDPVRARTGVQRTFELGEVRDYQMNLATTRGATLAVSFNATLYRDASDNVVGIFAVARPKEDLCSLNARRDGVVGRPAPE